MFLPKLPCQTAMRSSLEILFSHPAVILFSSTLFEQAANEIGDQVRPQSPAGSEISEHPRHVGHPGEHHAAIGDRVGKDHRVAVHKKGSPLAPCCPNGATSPSGSTPRTIGPRRTSSPPLISTTVRSRTSERAAEPCTYSAPPLWAWTGCG